MATFHKTEETMKRVSNTILVFLKIPQISLSLYSIHYNFILEEGAEAFDSIIQKVFRQPSLFKKNVKGSIKALLQYRYVRFGQGGQGTKIKYLNKHCDWRRTMPHHSISHQNIPDQTRPCYPASLAKPHVSVLYTDPCCPRPGE